MVRNILHEYKIHNADILIREDITVCGFCYTFPYNERLMSSLMLLKETENILNAYMFIIRSIVSPLKMLMKLLDGIYYSISKQA